MKTIWGIFLTGFANTPNLVYHTPNFLRWLHWGSDGGSHFDSRKFRLRNSFLPYLFRNKTIYINSKRCKPDLNHLIWRTIHVCIRGGKITIKITRTTIIIMDVWAFRGQRTPTWGRSYFTTCQRHAQKWHPRQKESDLIRLPKAVKGFIIIIILTFVLGILLRFFRCVTLLQTPKWLQNLWSRSHTDFTHQ